MPTIKFQSAELLLGELLETKEVEYSEHPINTEGRDYKEHRVVEYRFSDAILTNSRSVTHYYVYNKNDELEHVEDVEYDTWTLSDIVREDDDGLPFDDDVKEVQA